jgi:hypothetical protein
MRFLKAMTMVNRLMQRIAQIMMALCGGLSLYRTAYLDDTVPASSRKAVVVDILEGATREFEHWQGFAESRFDRSSNSGAARYERRQVQSDQSHPYDFAAEMAGSPLWAGRLDLGRGSGTFD